METQISLSVSQSLYERMTDEAKLRKVQVEKIFDEMLRSRYLGVNPTEPQDALDREIEAFRAMHPQLVEQYFGQHVAVYGGELIDHDVDRNLLLDRVRRGYPSKIVLVREVTEEVERVLHFRSPRLLPITETDETVDELWASLEELSERVTAAWTGSTDINEIMAEERG